MYATATKKSDRPAPSQSKAAKSAPVLNQAPQWTPLWAQVILPLQASLKINRPGDHYEQEADRVAEQVMRMPAPGVQRKTCACGKPAGPDGMCEDCKRKQLGIQRMSSSDAPQTTAPPSVQQVLRQPGRPLDAPTRNFMESRFGQDFGRVRIHTAAKAAESTKALRARAYTLGRNIVFGAGQYAPRMTEGRRLLAHELTHVVQQTGSPAKARIQMQRYTNCSENQSERIENSRRQARNFIHIARARLNNAPAAGTTYAVASQRHFISPNAAQRATIRTTFGDITDELRHRNNIICDPTNAECDGATQAFWNPNDDLIHICNRFWHFGPTCRAIILVHEAAHDIGIDAAPGAHQPNRGDPEYPAGNTAPPAGQTTAGRMNFSDAYAFFAHHVWNNADTTSTCF